MGPITAGRSLNLSNCIFLSVFRQLTNSILQFMDTGNFPVFAYLHRGGIFKLLRSPGIGSKESIPPVSVLNSSTEESVHSRYFIVFLV
jgi:hypothetical protein